MSKQTANLMPQVAFNILLALSLKPRHGYEIIKQVELDSNGRVKLGPGALYGTIKQLRENRLIEEIASNVPSDRRRYYQLTREGWDQLNLELQHYENTIKVAKTRQLIGEAIWAN